MFAATKTAVVAAGFAGVMCVVCLAPRLSAQQAAKRDPETLVVEDAHVDWIEISSVAALREGVINEMEVQYGTPVKKGEAIGTLRSEMASLAVQKAQTAVEKQAPTAKAKAQKELAAAVVAINDRLNARIKGAVSQEEMMKAEAELKVAQSMVVEATEQIKADQVELLLAQQALREHTITAPFEGVVIERMKNPGEKVGQAEAVVKIGNLNRLRAFVYIPAEYAHRVKEGDVVDLQPRLAGTRSNPLPIEQKRFRGKVTFVDPQIQPEGETAVRIYSEFDNPEHELRPGLRGTLTVYLGTSGTPTPPAAAVGARIR